MAFDFKNPYAPPGVYTESEFESNVGGTLGSTNIPMLIGPGNEILSRINLEVVRGSSQTVDQRVPLEDLTGRAVNSDGELVDFDGEQTLVKVRNYPIVTGAGNGLATTKPADITAFINGEPIVVLAVKGTEGLVELAEAPSSDDEVLITYFFNRTDTEQTDDVSSQISGDTAEIVGTADSSGNFDITDTTNTFIVSADGETSEITIPVNSGTTLAQMLGFINAEAPGSLVASSTTDNEGSVVITLSADMSIVIGAGTANATLGFSEGDSTERSATFYTHQRPIVDGTNAGRTLSSGDVSGVLVTVDGEEVAVADVDGKAGAVTLEEAPAAGSTVEITYFWNSWQDTFDYVFDIGLNRVLRCGVEAGRMDYSSDSDFVLFDDKIHWGSSIIVEAGEATEGTAGFGSSQITAQAADVRVFLEPCSSVSAKGSTSLKKFSLQRVPTSGNGTGSPGNEYPLSMASFSKMTNKRRDVWSNRPELIKVYAGYSLADAVSRGEQTVAWVDANVKQFTLAEAIEPGMTVYATYWYNRMDDQSFTLSCVSSGGSGVGTYSIEDAAGNNIFGATLTAKGAGLVEVLQWESGNSNLPLARFESTGGDLYAGPVNETVTVTLASKDATPAKMSFAMPGPYYFIDSDSDAIVFDIDAQGDTSNDLSVGPAAAVLTTAPASYEAAGGSVDWTIEAGLNDGIVLDVDGSTVAATVAAGSRDLSDFADALNTAAAAVPVEYVCPVRIRSTIQIAAGIMDELKFGFEDNISNSDLTATIAAGTYTTVGDLAAAVQTAVDAAIAGIVLATERPTVTVSANSAGQLVFAVSRCADATAAGESMAFSFVDAATELQSFAKGVAGMDTAAVKNTTQTILLDGPIAVATAATAGASGAVEHQVMMIRNRIYPGSSSAGGSLEVLSGTALDLLGLSVGDSCEARTSGTVIPASLTGYIGTGRGYFDPADAALGNKRNQAKLKLYDGSDDAFDANDKFEVTINGVTKTIVFAASGTGTETALGPVGEPTSVLGQMDAQLTGDYEITQEGASFVLASTAQDADSKVTVGSGSANTILGMNEGESAIRSGVPASVVVGHLATDTTSAAWFKDFDFSASTGLFADGGLARTVIDETKNEFLQVESGSLGLASSVVVGSGSTVFRFGSAFLGSAGDADYGGAAKSGFIVTSDNADGSGSAGTSVLGSGAGQDGVVGQTYRDAVTGLTFTLLPPLGGGNYTTNLTSTFELTCSDEIICDANNPIESLAGMQLFVANTSGVAEGDSATITTHHKNGKEPAIGQSYYISYEYEKRNYTPRLFTKVSTIEAAFGKVGAENQTSLASYLMFLNGATVLGVKQVKREEGKTNGSLASYEAAVEELEGLLPGRIRPSVLVPMLGYSPEFGRFMSLHVDSQSNTTNKAERTAILGFSAGTQPSEAAEMIVMLDRGVNEETGVEESGNPRIRCMYPDMLTVTTTDALGNEKEELVDGRYLAAMMAARQLSPNRDPATPWTGTQLVGTNGLARNLDAVSMNQVATAGITVCENRPPFIKVRQGLTTDMNSVMSKTPTVVQIADEVHQRSRDTLDGFIGVKFLPSVVSQIEGRMATMYKDLVKSQIVAAYTGIKAQVNADDQTACSVESFYQPIFPLLYIVLKFNIRSSL